MANVFLNDALWRVQTPPPVFFNPQPRPRENFRASYTRYKSALRRRGFIQLGEGFFSSVWAKPGSLNVIKVSNTLKDAWLEFAELVRDRHRGNPYAPQVGRIKRYATFYVAVIGRLGTTLRGAHAAVASRVGGLYEVAVRAFYEATGAAFDRQGRPTEGSLALLHNMAPGMAALARDLAAFIVTPSLDLHDENFLVADDGQGGFRLVVTDPISGGTYRRSRRPDRRLPHDA